MTTTKTCSLTNSYSINPVKNTGSLTGGILLLSGSCIGAGMLALPIFTAMAGFFPTLLIFVLCWFYMMTTAFLLIEAFTWFPEDTHLLSITEKTLGKKARTLVWVFFLFLFYSLLVAYIAKGGDLLHKSLEILTHASLPSWIGPTLLTVFSFIVTFYGITNSDRFNRLGMLGLFLVLIYLLGYGVEATHLEYVSRADWSLSLSIVPFIVTSFGFHNMIPTLHQYLGKNFQKTKQTLLIGSLIPFAVYILWIFKVITVIPYEGAISLKNSYLREELSTETLMHFFQNPLINVCAQYFAFFAIITSIFGQSLSIKDFFADGLKIVKTSKRTELFLCLLTFLPPYIFALSYAHVFGFALELVGGVACMVLFGIIPVCIIWQGRYNKKLSSEFRVKGEKSTLVAVCSIASLILIFEIFKNMGLI